MEEYTPVTSEEKAAVAIMTERIMVATPHTLAGHDQYWDDAIAAANLAAKRSCCAERIYEYEGPFGGPFHKTGRFREMNSVATK